MTFEDACEMVRDYAREFRVPYGDAIDEVLFTDPTSELDSLGPDLEGRLYEFFGQQ